MQMKKMQLGTFYHRLVFMLAAAFNAQLTGFLIWFACDFSVTCLFSLIIYFYKRNH